MPLFSVIVPVYNVEDYLKECVDSILNQSFKDFEIILVNDGSTDNSGSLCDEFKANNENIIVVHKENGGLSSARNAGVKASSGKYLLFVDSDDFLANEEALSNIVPFTNENKDIILLGMERYYRDNTTSPVIKEVDEKTLLLPTDKLIYALIKDKNFISSACNKCIKKDYFIKNNLFFIDGLLSEDIEWSIRILLTLNDFSITNKPHYYYRQTREGSISTTVSLKHIGDFTRSLEECVDNVNSSNVSSLRKDAINNYLGYQYLILMAYYQEGKAFKKSIKKLSFLLNYDEVKKVRIINLVRKIIGYEITSIILNILVRNRK